MKGITKIAEHASRSGNIYVLCLYLCLCLYLESDKDAFAAPVIPLGRAHGSFPARKQLPRILFTH